MPGQHKSCEMIASVDSNIVLVARIYERQILDQYSLNTRLLPVEERKRLTWPIAADTILDMATNFEELGGVDFVLIRHSALYVALVPLDPPQSPSRHYLVVVMNRPSTVEHTLDKLLSVIHNSLFDASAFKN